MEEYSIKEISNGWILQGWIINRTKSEVSLLEEKEIFLPTISAVIDILEIWMEKGFVSASAKAKEKYGWRI